MAAAKIAAISNPTIPGGSSKLYEISGNETFKKFQNMLLLVFEYVHSSGLLRKDVAVKKYVSHKGLVDIIEHGSAEMLRNGMRNHFARIF